MKSPRAKRPGARGKVALVCGGGGITGGVFEVGCLRALDQALGGGVVENLDLYAGASAGSIVATMLAAGVSPNDMQRLIVTGSRNRWGLPALSRKHIYGMDVGQWIATTARVPAKALGSLVRGLLPGEGTRPADAVFDAIKWIPSGIFTNRPLGKYLDRVLDAVGPGRQFEDLHAELMITAVNVDTGTRVVFGEPGTRGVPISTALRASAAIPLLFRPVRIDEQDFVDGGIEDNVPVDVAVKHGATLVIALNPLVPLVNDPRSDGSLLNGYRYLADHGMTSVLDQVFRMLVRSQVQQRLRQVRDQFPEVDIVLFEPEATDATMFAYHPMRYSVRELIAEHAYEATCERLIRDADHLTDLFARHGLDFDATRLSQRKVKEEKEGMVRRGLRLAGKIPKLRGWIEATDAPEPF
jgi:NTE family protein